MRRGRKTNRLLDYWVGIPLLNALATFHIRRVWPERVERIGVMCSPALGDTLLFSAVAVDLRRAFPQAELVHFCMRQNLAAAELIPGIDRRVVLDLTKPAQGIANIRVEHLDVLLDFSSWQRLTAFYTMMSGARFTAGFGSTGQRRGRGFDLTVEHRADRHEVDNFRALMGALNLATGAEPQIKDLDLLDEPFAKVEDVVLFHPWASGQRSWLREWPQERWIKLAHTLGLVKTLFVITGAPTDRIRSETLVEQMTKEGLRAETYTSPDGFISLVHLLRRARVVISVNTGVMHLAAIVGAATVSINGPNRNGRWGPVGRFARGVEAPGEGCGYLHLGFEFGGRATDCMQRISVEMIASAAHELQQQRSEVECEMWR